MNIFKPQNTFVCTAFIALLNVALPAHAAGGHSDDSHSHSGSHHDGMEGMEGMNMSEDHNRHDDMSMSDTVNGTVVSVDRKQRKLVLNHEAMANIGMDSMQMGFSVADSIDLRSLKKGQRVSFTVDMVAGSGMLITAIQPLQ